jgi:hypothetical protein
MIKVYMEVYSFTSLSDGKRNFINTFFHSSEYFHQNIRCAFSKGVDEKFWKSQTIECSLLRTSISRYAKDLQIGIIAEMATQFFYLLQIIDNPSTKVLSCLSSKNV